MDEIIVRVLRTVACVARLRILSRLVGVREGTPTALAEELDMPIDLVSTHLRRLSLAGLIRRRPSGARCYCRADSPYSDEAFSGKIMSWLRSKLGDPARAAEDSVPEQGRNLRPGDLASLLHSIIFEAATAFTHRRRVQILRRLADGEAVDGPTLMRELHMSKAAVSRHTDKLRRRGYVDAGRAGHRLVYGLASEFKTRLHEELYQMVQVHWMNETFRT